MSSLPNNTSLATGNAEEEVVLKNPITAAVWKALSPLAQECITMIQEADQCGQLDMFNGAIAITVRQRKAITINPTAELRPGHEIMRPPSKLFDASAVRSLEASVAEQGKEAPSPVSSGSRVKLLDSRRLEAGKEE